jgi:hypothetical protein
MSTRQTSTVSIAPAATSCFRVSRSRLPAMLASSRWFCAASLEKIGRGEKRA